MEEAEKHQEYGSFPSVTLGLAEDSSSQEYLLRCHSKCLVKYSLITKVRRRGFPVRKGQPAATPTQPFKLSPRSPHSLRLTVTAGTMHRVPHRVPGYSQDFGSDSERRDRNVSNNAVNIMEG